MVDAFQHDRTYNSGGPEFGSLGSGVSVLVKTKWRLIKESDRDFLINLFKMRYPDFDLIAVDQWVTNVVMKQPLLFLPIRSSHAALIAMMTLEVWAPTEPECFVVSVTSEDGHVGETADLLRVSVEWSKQRGAVRWRFHCDTQYDVSPLMRRIGAKQASPRYVIDLREHQWVD